MSDFLSNLSDAMAGIVESAGRSVVRVEGRRRLAASGVVWSGMPPQTAPFECHIQIRYRHEAVSCTVTPAPGRFSAVFHAPQRAVTPGQWAVLYRGDMVLAAGTIDTFE